MNFLEERIVKDGIVKPGNILKVDSFLNHQMDVELLQEIAREFKRRFGHKTITKIMTIEASGIGIAAFVAKEFGVPMIFAKKSKSINIDGDNYHNYIFGNIAGVDWTGTDNYDGCTFLETAPAI